MILPQNGKVLLESIGEHQLLKSFTGLKIKFLFPSNIQYPNLPVRLDFSSIIFPLEGETFCTGSEFLLAMRLNCEISIPGGVHIPFQNSQPTTKPKPKPKRNREKEVYIIDPQITTLVDVYQKA